MLNQEIEISNDDVSVLGNDDEPTNYNAVQNGVGNDEYNNGYNFVSALALRKNLTETFEKHATAADDDVTTKMGNKSKAAAAANKKVNHCMGSGVKDKIKAFERSAGSVGSAGSGPLKVKFESNTTTTTTTTTTTSSSNHNSKPSKGNIFQKRRPPTIPPINTKVGNETIKSSSSSSQESGPPLLSVSLRIRPPISSDTNDEQGESAFNTVEILQPTKNDNGEIISNSIRTYPPIQSNAAKVVRGQHPLYNHSNNSDLIFAKNSGVGRNGGGSGTIGKNDNAVNGVKEFNFKQVFGPKTSQEDVYKGVAMELVEGLFPKEQSRMVGDKPVGQSALLFSYGITNAGKTYTIMGKEDEKKRKKVDRGVTDGLLDGDGIIPRALHHILTKIEEMERVARKEGRDDVKYHVKMSFFEIYNEQIFDLLPVEKNESKGNGNALSSRYPPGVVVQMPLKSEESLKIRERKNGKPFVAGLGVHIVSDFAHGLELANEAKNKRHFSSNNINKDSSRSHCICKIDVVAGEAPIEDDNASVNTATSFGTDDGCNAKKRSAVFWVVDLAGSERSKRTGAYGKSMRQKEAALINSSLMKLMRCLQTIRNNQTSSTNSMASIVPFRESKLTHLFMEHLSGSSASRTSMIVNINPAVSDFDESQHVLSYATVARSIRISESDYNRKRRAIQMSGNNGKSNKNGKKANGRDLDKMKSPPKKIARLMKKLSPRAALARRRKQMSDTEKRKAELLSLRGVTTSGTGASNSAVSDLAKNEKKRARFNGVISNKKKLEDENNELLELLKASKKEVAELQEKLDRCESDIRIELAEETEVHLKFIREQHNEVVNSLRQQIRSAPTPSKSAMKVREDKAQVMVEELMDKVDECEEEMTRMRDKHEDELNKMNHNHEEEIAAINSLKEEEAKNHELEISKLKSLHAETIKEKERRICELEAERDAAYNEEHDDTYDSDEDSVSDITTEKENYPTSSTPKVRRLPRQRCSEVACADLSPTHMIVSSSTKKKKGFGLGVRSPLYKLAGNENTSAKKK